MKISQHRYSGMTLVEVMMAMSVLTIMSAGIISAVFLIRADAENNLYESSSLNCAISFLEQTKAEVYKDLESPETDLGGAEYIRYVVGFNQFLNIPLGVDTVVDVPIISTEDGSVKKSLPVTVNITLTDGTSLEGFWIEVDYSWTHPTTSIVYGGEVRGFRSLVSTF